jgi:NAD(P)-dependent dehydrogenase (short-subunit alcohol dehydrogenase family)
MATEALARFSVPGQVAVVTGGGSGIGRAACELLTAAGAKVAVLDVNRDSAGQVADAIGGTAHAADVTDEAALEASFAEIAETHGRLDILVNNAGIAVRGPATTLALDDWNRVVGVNLTGMFLNARIAARHMERFGNGASIMGLSGGLFPNAAYQASKGGVVNLTRALALEWAALRIRVNAVAPTYARTGLTVGLLQNPEAMAAIAAATPLGRLAEPEEIASAILFLASPAAAMITGAILPVDGGYLAR